MASETTQDMPRGISLAKMKDLHLQLRTPKPASSKRNTVYSPVTDLAMNLNELSTCSYFDDTPKRKLSLMSDADDTPTPPMFRPLFLDKRLSLDDGSCSPLDSPSLDLLREKRKVLDSAKKEIQEDVQTGEEEPMPENKENRSPLEMKSAAYRRFQAMPVPFCGFAPTPPSSQIRSDTRQGSDNGLACSLERTPEKKGSPEKGSPRSRTPDSKKGLVFHDEGSQDSGLGLDKDCDFKAPLAPAPRRSRVLSDETNSPSKYSPAKSKSPRPLSDSILHFGGSLLRESPTKLRCSSLTSSSECDEGDDGFLEILDDDEACGGGAGESPAVPSGLEGLFKAPVLRRQSSTPLEDHLNSPVFTRFGQENTTPGSSRRGLFRSPSAPRLMAAKAVSFDSRPRPAFKRSEPCHDADTPVQSKRRKSIRDGSTPEKITHKLQRCHSETEAVIKSALVRADEQQNLIGDFSKAYCLPTIPGKKQDLMSITPDTLAAVLNNEYSHTIEKYVVIDARYPYEYDGGHIQSAKNVYTKPDMMKEFMESTEHRSTSYKRHVVIFHCEFSSERGPAMARFLRNMDRDANKECYPSLHYPEIYLLHDGYKEFFSQKKELCQPETYLPMLHENHSQDLKHFRAKSKSWAGCDPRSKKGGRFSFRSGLKL